VPGPAATSSRSHQRVQPSCTASSGNSMPLPSLISTAPPTPAPAPAPAPSSAAASSCLLPPALPVAP
jgi:hypothetical protein